MGIEPNTELESYYGSSLTELNEPKLFGQLDPKRTEPNPDFPRWEYSKVSEVQYVVDKLLPAKFFGMFFARTLNRQLLSGIIHY